MEDNTLEKKFSKFIVAVSIIIPVVVAILFGVKLKDFGIAVEPFIVFASNLCNNKWYYGNCFSLGCFGN